MVSFTWVSVLPRSLNLRFTYTGVTLCVPSMTPCWRPGMTSDRSIGTAEAPNWRILARSAAVALTRSFLPLKSSSLRIGCLPK